jgi:hypothetical protein
MRNRAVPCRTCGYPSIRVSRMLFELCFMIEQTYDQRLDQVLRAFSHRLEPRRGHSNAEIENHSAC